MNNKKADQFASYLAVQHFRLIYNNARADNSSKFLINKKTSVKLISLLLIIFMTAASMCVPVLGEEGLSDAALPEQSITEAHTTAFELIQALGIIQDESADLFLSSPEISREEFVIITGRMLNLHNQMENTGPVRIFTDVEPDSEISGYVYYLNQMGIIDGYGGATFAPDESVTYIQVLKTFMSAMGYSLYAQQKGDFPTGYLIAAAEKSLFDFSAVDINAAITGKDMVIMIRNALEADMMSESVFGAKTQYVVDAGVSLLTKFHNIFKQQGQVSRNRFTTLTGVDVPDKNLITINQVDINDDTDSASGLLGCYVTCYYKLTTHDKQLVYLYEQTDRYKSLTIAADDITGYDNGTYKYQSSRAIREETISKTASVIYNGKLLTKYDQKHLVPSTGSVKFIYAGQEGDKDVVIITSYTNCVVSNVSLVHDMIFDKYDSAYNVKLHSTGSNYTVIIKDIDGHPAGLNNIGQGSVLAVATSSDQLLTNIIIVGAKITGTVSGYQPPSGNSAGMVIARDVEYLFSRTRTHNQVVAVGLKYDIYLDIENKIIAMENVSGDDITFGFLMGAKIEGMNIEFRILTDLNEKVTLKGASGIVFNGEKIKSSAFEKIISFLSSNGKFSAQIVRYSLNTDNEINRLYTVESIDDGNSFYQIGGINDKRFNALSYDNQYDTQLKYTLSTRRFWPTGSGAMGFFVSPDAIIFDVPGKKTDNFAIAGELPMYQADTDAGEDKFGANSVSSLVNGTHYSVDAYAIKHDDRYAYALVRYMGGETTISGFLHRDIPRLMVSSITTTISDDGQHRKKLYGVREGRIVGYIGSQDYAFNGIQEGDYVRLALNSQGEVIDHAHVYEVSKSDPRQAYKSYYTSYPTAWSNSFTIDRGTDLHGRYLYGWVYDREGTNFIDIYQGEGYSEQTMTEHRFETHNIGVVLTIGVYDSSKPAGQRVSLGSREDIITYKEDSTKYTHAVFHTYTGNVRDIMIYK